MIPWCKEVEPGFHVGPALPFSGAAAGHLDALRLPLRTSGCCPGHRTRRGQGINIHAQVVGTSMGPHTLGFRILGFFWHAGTMTPLLPLPGASSSSALGLNNPGQVAGDGEASPDTFGFSRGLLWNRH